MKFCLIRTLVLCTIFIVPNIRFSYSEEFKFDVTDFTQNSKIISNIKGPVKHQNKIIMSSLEGDTAVSGKGNLINIELKYENTFF